jgi:hypothetical protein
VLGPDKLRSTNRLKSPWKDIPAPPEEVVVAVEGMLDKKLPQWMYPLQQRRMHVITNRWMGIAPIAGIPGLFCLLLWRLGILTSSVVIPSMSDLAIFVWLWIVRSTLKGLADMWGGGLQSQ